MDKSKGGRPNKINETVVNKLSEAFSFGYTDGEACYYAGISKPCLYDYCKKNPEFSDRKEILKKNPITIAKRNIVRAMDENYNKDEKSIVETSKWYLERKCKDEFSTRQEQTGKDGADLQPPVLNILPVRVVENEPDKS